MCEKKYVKKTRKFRNYRRLIEYETFVYPVGIKSTQSISLVLQQPLLPSMKDNRLQQN